MVPLRPIVPRAFLPSVFACVLALAACGESGGQAEQSGNENESVAAETSDTENGITSSNKKSYVVFADFVSEADSLPRLKYRDDGQVTLNDRCPVRLVRLNPKMPAAYVNGRPVGFC